MSAKFDLGYQKTIKRIITLATLFTILGIVNNTSATIIDFDDLNPVYYEVYPCWCDNPLTDQYLSKGLLIAGAWVNGGNSHNFMLTSNGASLDFVGDLPTFFSMNINSVHDDAVMISIYGSSGLLAQKFTAGWIGPEENYIPVIPNEFFSFSSPTGIQHVDIEGVYDLRTGAFIDNLTYTYASVPEPSSLLLIALGLLGVGLGRFKTTR